MELTSNLEWVHLLISSSSFGLQNPVIKSKSSYKKVIKNPVIKKDIYVLVLNFLPILWICPEQLGKRKEYLNDTPTFINFFDPENNTVNYVAVLLFLYKCGGGWETIKRVHFKERILQNLQKIKRYTLGNLTTALFPWWLRW